MSIVDKINSIKQHLGEAYSSLEEKGATIPDNKNIENLADSILTIEGGGGGTSRFTGHVDVQGLTTIGWTDEDIEYFQNNVFWNEEDDDYYKLYGSELTGTNTNNRFLMKTPPQAFSTFNGYSRLIAVPYLNRTYSNVNLFNNCYSLTSIAGLTFTGTSASRMFSGCYSLSTIPLIDFSTVTNMTYMFTNAYSLITIPLINMSNVTHCQSMFYNCKSLKHVPAFDTHNLTSSPETFYGCNSLMEVPKLDFSKNTDTAYLFYECSSLRYLGGFENLGQAFLTSASASKREYKLEFIYSLNLTHDSIMNVINNLYDIASAGCQPQDLALGNTNKNKLTAEEIAIATSKGWNVT